MTEQGEGGVCPSCGSENITYEEPIKEGDKIIILPFSCDDCSIIGQETYDAKFKGVDMVDANEFDDDLEDDDLEEMDEDDLNSELDDLDNDNY